MESIFANTLEIIKKLQIEPSVRYRGLLNDIPPIKDNNIVVKVDVVNADCIDTCIRIIKENPESRVGLLNMASEYKPGGGVANPRFIMAQEEELCRRLSLYPTLMQQKYPLNVDEIIYTPNVKILKSADYKEYTKYLNITGVISSAAIRRPILSENGYYSSEDIELLNNKIQMLLETFEYHNIDNLVLGAWGCGVFRNPPRQVALTFKKILFSDRFKYSFKQVIFAVAVIKPHDQKNYDEFKHVFRTNV